MAEKQLSNDYLEGYTKAKEEDKEEINKAYETAHLLEHEYAILKEARTKDSLFIQDNAKYIELGKAAATILDYIRGNKNVE